MQFAQKIVNSTNVGDNIVFMGHSRGSENALRLAARNPVRSLVVKSIKKEVNYYYFIY